MSMILFSDSELITEEDQAERRHDSRPFSSQEEKMDFLSWEKDHKKELENSQYLQFCKGVFADVLFLDREFIEGRLATWHRITKGRTPDVNFFFSMIGNEALKVLTQGGKIEFSKQGPPLPWEEIEERLHALPTEALTDRENAARDTCLLANKIIDEITAGADGATVATDMLFLLNTASKVFLTKTLNAGIQGQVNRWKGGQLRARKAAMKGNPEHERIEALGRKLLARGDSPSSLVGTLERNGEISATAPTIRKVLQNAGILEKRKKKTS